MLIKVKAACRLYLEETRTDWVVLTADIIGVVIVGLAFIQARIGGDTSDSAVQMASALF
ncbi:hypothetical protein SAMN04488040_2454 [Sulfitobacter marinus]|uniref:Uncharacterized protein n=2 Tax=Sulfitobacter marinus TaxID=394264 RepID=A0A1I6U208_9RHOB|nr:hypothetical protein SAMN04488040_2454 [Sulfitobacter marinus]